MDATPLIRLKLASFRCSFARSARCIPAVPARHPAVIPGCYEFRWTKERLEKTAGSSSSVASHSGTVAADGKASRCGTLSNRAAHRQIFLRYACRAEVHGPAPCIDPALTKGHHDSRGEGGRITDRD